MTVFWLTLDRMAFLFSFIIIGYLLVKLGILNVASAGVLSKLENNVFLPAMVMGTFIANFTVDRLGSLGLYFLAGFVFVGIAMPLGYFFANRCVKDEYQRRIYTYGLVIPNFGFMGNAIVSAIYPDFFTEYLIFTLPLWVMILMWAFPKLLIGTDGDNPTLGQRIKTLFHPVLVAMLVGMVLGLVLGLLDKQLPPFVDSLISSASNCMSPVAMLLTGITVAGINVPKVLKIRSIWAVSVIRLFLLPLITLGVIFLLPIPFGIKICAVCAASMPLGLNTVVVPAAYGRDTSQAAGMALISHILSCISIPLMFMLIQFAVTESFGHMWQIIFAVCVALIVVALTVYLLASIAVKSKKEEKETEEASPDKVEAHVE